MNLDFKIFLDYQHIHHAGAGIKFSIESYFKNPLKYIKIYWVFLLRLIFLCDFGELFENVGQLILR